MKTIVLAMALMLTARGEVEERNTTRKNFPVSGGAVTLIVDNIEGGITVTGSDTNEVQVTAEERWRADSAERMQEARRDVRLDMSQQGGTVKLFVDGPFRCKDGSISYRGDRHYRVRFDFTIRAPRGTRIELKTVNGGDVKTAGIEGSFDVHNVNGGIELTGLTAGGDAHTVNGRVHASFRQSPAAAVSLKSVNGEIVATFPPNLSADLQMKTLNGAVLTDFDVTMLPNISPVATRRGAGVVIRGNRSVRVRTGAGGPEHRFETLNGEIRILKGK